MVAPSCPGGQWGGGALALPRGSLSLSLSGVPGPLRPPARHCSDWFSKWMGRAAAFPLKGSREAFDGWKPPEEEKGKDKNRWFWVSVGERGRRGSAPAALQTFVCREWGRASGAEPQRARAAPGTSPGWPRPREAEPERLGMCTAAPREVGAPGWLGGFGGAAGREELLQERDRARDPQAGPGPFPSSPSWVGPEGGLLGIQLSGEV